MLKATSPLATRNTPTPGQRSNAVCVLGMHRSGTSCLAGSLEEAGLAFGEEIIKEAPYNLKGNRENPRIMALHQDVLASNAGSWDHPPLSVQWAQEHRDRRDEILDSYREFDVWGFKDPRTLLVLEGWREALPNLRFVATFRHPLAVAKSLNARDHFPLEQGIKLWTTYNRILLRYQAELGFDVICFDRQPTLYQARLAEISLGLGLKPPSRGFTFFESKLRHNSAELDASVPSEAVPSEAASIYEALLRVEAEEEADPGAFDSLDRRSDGRT